MLKTILSLGDSSSSLGLALVAFATSHFLACTIDGKCSNGLPVCPMMALSGHHTRTYEWPLSGVKRTAMSAHDPKADMRKSQIRLEEAAQNGTVAVAPRR